jgi:flagellar hook assembly protein FlgD
MTLNIVDKNGKVVQKGPQNSRMSAGGRNMRLNTRKLKEGEYQIIVEAVDESGKKTTLYRDLTIDHTPPTITKPTKTDITQLPTSSATSGKVSNIGFTLSEDTFLTIRIFDSAKKLVRTLVQKKLFTKGVNSVEWDGYDMFNKMLPDATYSVVISGYDYVRIAARPAKTTVIINRKAPTISGIEATPSPFNPVTAGKITLKYTLDEAAKVTIAIYQNDGTTLVKTVANNLAKVAGNSTATWNGKNNANAIVANGTYVYKIKAVDASGMESEETGTFIVNK